MEVKKQAAIFAVVTTVMLFILVVVTFQQKSNRFSRKTRFLGSNFKFSKSNHSSLEMERALWNYLEHNFKARNRYNSLSNTKIPFWNFLKPKFSCPKHRLMRVGYGLGGDGAKWTCGLDYFGFQARRQNFSCLVYSFGVRDDSSFEAGVLERTPCTVYAYDPKVNIIAKPLNASNPRVKFFKMGVGGNNTRILTTLKTMMKNNGNHKWIDILKMDIEEAEYEALEKVFQDFKELPIGQLLLEVHVWKGTHKKAAKLIEKLEKRGFRIFSIDNNKNNPYCCVELALINIKTLRRFLEAEVIKRIGRIS